jgi:RNA polymerase sigma-32 factor
MAKAPGKSSKKAAKSTASKPASKPANGSTRKPVKKGSSTASSAHRSTETSARGGKSRVTNPEVIEPRSVTAELVEPEEDSGATGLSPLASEFPDRHSDSDIDPDRDLLDELDDGALAAIEPEIVEPAPSESKALATSDPVAAYLAELRRYPLLTREQERELAIRYRETGDPRAAEMLVTSNLRFVVKIAAEYSRFGAKLIDLIQEGNVGLMHAVKEFNPYKGVRLITYAVWWIRGYIQEYLMRQYSLVRIGTTQNQRKLFYRLQKERDALQATGQEPSFALLAGRLGVTEEEVETMSQRLASRDISLNVPVDGGSSTASLLDFEAAPEESVDERIGHLEEMEVLRENLEKIRSTLSEKETFILENRILADEPLTLQEIGDHYRITREAVRQLEARLIGKIRAAVTSSLRGGDDSES